MKSETNDIYEMLDTLALPAAAQRFAQLSESPELGSYTALQLLREVLEPQYIETLNKRFETNLRLSSLINKGAVAENLKTGNGRIYNDATVEQVLEFHFAENRQNVGIYGCLLYTSAVVPLDTVCFERASAASVTSIYGNGPPVSTGRLFSLFVLHCQHLSIFTVITVRFLIICHVFHPPDILTVFSGFGNLIVLGLSLIHI